MAGERVRAEEGFTLIELLIAIMVSGFLLMAITTGFITALGATTGAHERFIESHDAQLLATYFTSDVQSADPGAFNASSTLSGTDTGCSVASPGTNVLRLQWAEATSSTTATAFAVSYRMDAAAPGRLLRYYCSGATLSAAPLTSRVVARDLSTAVVTPPPTGTTRLGLNLTSIKAASESAAYSYTFSASMRTPAPSKFLLAPVSPQVALSPQVAGTQFKVSLTASTDGTTPETSYSGTRTVTFSGPNPSPNNTSPAYPTTVDFTGGVGTAAITLFKAETTALAVTDAAGRHLGTVPAVTVAAAKVPLIFFPCPPSDTTGGGSTPEQIVRGADPYGNPDPNLATSVPPVALTATGGATFAPISLTIAAGSAASLPSTLQKPSSGTPVSLTGQTTAAGYTNAGCAFIVTGPNFLVTTSGPQVAGTAFDVTITATSNGAATDTGYSGDPIINFGGPVSSPGGTAPSYPATVHFSGGVGTASIRLFNAATAVLTVGDGTLQGSTSVTVGQASIPLTFSNCSPDPAKKATTPESVLRGTDLYGNADANPSTLTVTLAATNGGTFSPTTVDLLTGDSTSALSTYKNPNAIASITMTGTASSPGYVYVNPSCPSFGTS